MRIRLPTQVPPVNVETSALRVEKNPRGSVKAAKEALAAEAGGGAAAAAAGEN